MKRTRQLGIGLVLALVAASAAGGTISGTVYAPGARPLAGAVVSALTDDAIAGMATAGATGAYQITGLPAGSYRVEFFDPSGWYAREFHEDQVFHWSGARVDVGAASAIQGIDATLTYATPAPTGIAATDGTQTDRITITWNPVPGASVYQVFRSSAIGQSPTAIGGWHSGVSFNDTSPYPTRIYTYYVRAAVGPAGERPSVFGMRDPGWRAVAAPAGVQASDGSYHGNVTVTWQSVPYATHYRVFRAETQEGPKEALGAWQTGLAFRDYFGDPARTYQYFIQAAGEAGELRPSAFSPSDAGWRALAPPMGVTATDGSQTDRIVVTWDAVPGATHYRVYRAESNNGEPTPLGSWQTDPVFHDVAATPARLYAYSVVAATDSTGTRPSGHSASDPGWRALAAPAGLSASDGAYAQRIAISWSAVPGASHYRLYRSETPDGPRTAISAWDVKCWFWDASGDPVRSYAYFVGAAADATGARASALAGPEEGWRLLPGPSGVVASDGGSNVGVSISWRALAGAAQYRVFRSESDGPREEIGTWQAGTSYLDTEGVPGRTYQYSVRAAAADDGWRPGLFSACDEGWRSLSAPGPLTASDGADADRTTLSWPAVPGATHYRVYRAEAPDGAKLALAGWETKRWFWDSSASPGRTYFYFVQAAADAGGLRASGFSTAESGWRALAAPAGVAATDGAYFGNVTIAWQAVPGATHYRVLGSDAPDGAGTPLGDWQTARTFRDYFVLPGHLRFYAVQAAVDVQGTRAGAASTPDSGWRRLAPPSGVAASDGSRDEAITITWEPVPGASHYQVLRAEHPDGERAALSTWDTVLAFTDAAAVPGRTYDYFVRAAADGEGGFPGGLSAAESGWRGLPAPAAPVASDGTTDGHVGIFWPAVPGATHYRVYRTAALDGVKTPISAWDPKCWFRDTGVPPAQTNYYFVQADAGGRGDRTSGFSPADPGWRLLAAPTGVAASDGPYHGNVTITWQAAPAATHYAVFRAAAPDGEPVPISPWLTELVFRDYTVLPGATHHYSVRGAVDEAGSLPGLFSASDPGWRMIPPPAGLVATDGGYADRTTLSWPETPGAACYRVYRAERVDGPKTALSIWDAKRWFWDVRGVAGQTYYYFIQAAAGSGGVRPGAMSAPEPGWRAVEVPAAPAGASLAPLATVAGATAAPSSTWHVDAARDDDAGTGLDWATAKRSLQAAVDAAADGDTILVAPGVYEPVATFNKPLLIASVDGAAATVIDGGCVLRGATLGNDAWQTNTVLRGFTVRNGCAAFGGGALGGTLEGCRLDGNLALEGGGAYGSTLIDCLLLSNLAAYGGGACEARLFNCTVEGNVAEIAGGGTYGCEVADSIVWGNVNALEQPDDQVMAEPGLIARE